MEEVMENPTAVKVEGSPHSVVLTYFQGDTNSMVEAHFKRALGKMSRAKEPVGRTRKIFKHVKSVEETSPCQDTTIPCHSELQPPPMERRFMTFGPSGESHSSWSSLGGMPGEATIRLPMSREGLGLTGHQYATSLLNLLHSDRGDFGPNMASISKPEAVPRWSAPPGFRESVDPSIDFDQGRHTDKKDLYWC